MKRALLLAGLLIAAPAQAQVQVYAKLILAQNVPIGAGNITAEQERMQWQAALGVCREWGIDYTLVPWQSTKIEWLRQGQVFTADGTLIQHDGFIIPGHIPTRWPGVDSMTLARTNFSGGDGNRWPTVDGLFMTTGDGVGLQDAAACSMGIRSVAPAGDAFNTSGFYVPGKDWVWREHGVSRAQAASSARTGGAYTGVWRGLIGVGAMAGPGSGSCEDCDAIVRSADPDTVQAWYHSRANAAGNPIGARMFFLEAAPGAQGGPINSLAYVIAKMDSTIFARTGKRLIQKRVKESLFIDRWFAAGNFQNGEGDTTQGGQFCPANALCDTVAVKATMDSLNSLDVPITFVCEMDSLDSFAYQDAQMRRVSKFRVSPTSVAGTYGVSGSHNNTPGRYLDLLGTRRDRTLIRPNGALGEPLTSYPGTDSSIVGKLMRADSTLESRYPGRVDRLVYAALDDWSPRNVTRADARTLDSLHQELHRLKYRGYRTNTLVYDADAGRGNFTGTDLNGNPLRAVRVRGYASSGQRFPVYAGGQRLGYMATVPYRSCELCSAELELATQHDQFHEYSWGLWTGEWYFDHQSSIYGSIVLFYEHQFQARTRMLELQANTLGSTGGAGTRRNRLSWWPAKWLVHRSRAINDAAGRTVMEVVTGEELAVTP